MTRKILALIWAALALGQVSCIVPSRVHLSPQGQEIQVDMNGGQRIRGELLSFQDRVFYVLDKSEGQGRIVQVSGADVSTVRIKGFHNLSWIPFVIGLEVLPAAGLIGAYMGESNGKLDSPMLLTFLPAIFTAVAFLTVKSEESFREVLIGQDLSIKKHARFPQGLTQDQLEELLRQSGQKELIIIK